MKFGLPVLAVNTPVFRRVIVKSGEKSEITSKLKNCLECFRVLRGLE